MKKEIIKIKEPKLSLKQKLFCQAYVDSFGNATEAILRAGYNISKVGGYPDRILAKSIASENLTKPNILAYINILLQKAGLNDENVATQHWFLVNQNVDFGVKAKAIDMYYKLKGKYTQTNTSDIEVNTTLHAVIEHVRKILPEAGQ